MLNYFKRDYASCKVAWALMTNGKMPDWAFNLMYVIVAPLIAVLFFPVLIAQWILVKKFEKDIREGKF